MYVRGYLQGSENGRVVTIASRYQISRDVKIPPRPKTSVTNRGPHSVSIWLVRHNSFYFSYYSKYMNLLHNHFLQMYVWLLYTYGKTNESEKTVRL